MSFVRGIIQRPVYVHLLQSIIIFPWYQTVQEMSFILTSHPALQNLTTEIRECDASPGMIRAILACGGSCGRGRVPMWLELMWPPLGNFTRIGTTVSSFCWTGILERIKWLDAPESTMAQFWRFSLVSWTVFRIVDGLSPVIVFKIEESAKLYLLWAENWALLELGAGFKEWL